MQPVFREFKRNLPFLISSSFATMVFAYVLRKVFSFLLSGSRMAGFTFSMVITLFFFSLTTCLVKTTSLSEEVRKSLG